MDVSKEDPQWIQGLMDKTTRFHVDGELSVIRRDDHWCVATKNEDVLINTDMEREYYPRSEGEMAAFKERTSFDLRGAFEHSHKYLEAVKNRTAPEFSL